MTKPLLLWTRNREGNFVPEPRVESAPFAATGIAMTFGITMKTGTKFSLSAMFLRAATLVGIILLLYWFSPGGIRSNYPAKENDPKLSKIARSVVPIIQKVEAFESRKGRLPETLEDLAVELSQIPPVYYMPISNHYILSIKLGWDPKLTFDSQDRGWTFDPGDGSPEKKIKLDVETTFGQKAEQL